MALPDRRGASSKFRIPIATPNDEQVDPSISVCSLLINACDIRIRARSRVWGTCVFAKIKSKEAGRLEIIFTYGRVRRVQTGNAIREY